jgi:Na+-driven multidrug efflux pump
MQAYKQTLQFVMAWQLLIYVILVVCSGWISEIFSDDKSVAEVIKLFIWILPLGYGLQGVIILTNSSFNALHRPSNALILSIIRLFVFYVPLAWIGSQFMDIQGLFFGGLLGNVFTATIAFLWFTHYVKTLEKTL